MSTAPTPPRTSPPWYLWLPSLAVAVGVAFPLGYLAVRAAEVGLAEMADAVFNRRNAWLLWNTVRLTAGVLVVTAVLGVPAAWLTTRTDLPLRRTLSAALVLPLAVPGYLHAFTLLSLGGYYGAWAQAMHALGWEDPWTFPRLNGYWGSLVAMSLYNLPYMVLTVRAALWELDPGLEEVARSLGHRPRKAFFTVVLPQLRPALLAGSLLVGLHVIMDFGVVSLMRYETFSYALYLRYASYDLGGAAVIALMMVGLAAVLVVTELAALGRVRLHRAGSGGLRRGASVPLGRWTPVAIAFVGTILTAAIVVPVATIAFWGTRGTRRPVADDLVPALVDSLQASLPAAVVATLLAMPIAYAARRYPARRTLLLERISYLGYATPALAFALGLLVVTLRIDSWFLPPGRTLLYQSMGVLVFAYALHFLAEAVGPIRASLLRASPRLEEAARSLGATQAEAFVRVTLPLMKGGLTASLALVFLSAMKELPLTMLLSPLGFDTLAKGLWDKTNEAMYAEAAPYAMAVLVISALLVAVLLAAERSPALTPRKQGDAPSAAEMWEQELPDPAATPPASA